jgi:hypothetical protein
MSSLAKWCEAKIVPGIGRRGAEGFSEEMCRRSMFVIADALTLGLVSDESAADCLSFVKACVDAASGLKDEVEASKMLHSAVKVAFQVCQEFSILSPPPFPFSLPFPSLPFPPLPSPPLQHYYYSRPHPCDGSLESSSGLACLI